MKEDIYNQLRSEDGAVRLAAIEALEPDIDPDALACLIAGLSDPEDAVRIRCRQILVATTHRDLGFEPDPWSSWWREEGSRRCNRCSRHLYDQKLYYKVSVKVTSEPTEVVLTADDLNKDHAAEIEKLCQAMSRQDPADIADEVYVFLDYFLCTRCKTSYVKSVRSGEMPG